MGLITFEYMNPGADGIDTPARGHLVFRLLDREVAGGAYRTVDDFRVDLVDGIATVVLSDTGPAQAWRISEARIAGAKIRHVAVTGDAAATALVDVDPATLQPGAAPAAAWTLALDELAATVSTITGTTDTQITAAVNAYLTQNPPSSAEPLLLAHLDDTSPHPVYDDIPSLEIFFENGMA